MQKALCYDSLYRQYISNLEIHCQLMLVFGDGVWGPHHLGRGCREYRGQWASNLKISALQMKNMWTLRKWRNWFCKATKTLFMIYPLHCSDLWKLYTTLFIYNWDTAICVHVWVPRYMMEVHKNWCLDVLFHIFSHLKEEKTSSLNLWWRYETWVYHFTQKYSGHIHLHWQPQNVKCAVLLPPFLPKLNLSSLRVYVLYKDWMPTVQ